MKVYVLSIEHKHGTDVFVYESKRDAEQHVVEYVASWWDEEKDRTFDPDQWGENPGGWESVERYFGELIEGEYYSIQETEVIPAAKELAVFEDSDHIAYFHPQAWQNDNAVDVDAEGPRRWVVSKLHLDKIRSDFSDRIAELYDSSDVSDEVKRDPAAPQWVREWSGPFYVDVTTVEED